MDAISSITALGGLVGESVHHSLLTSPYCVLTDVLEGGESVM